MYRRLDILLPALVIGVMLLVTLLWSWIGCGARWQPSGLATSWGPIQGCLVQVPGGRWVPADNVRGVDLESHGR